MIAFERQAESLKTMIREKMDNVSGHEFQAHIPLLDNPDHQNSWVRFKHDPQRIPG